MAIRIKKNNDTLVELGYIVMLLLTILFRTQYSIRLYIWVGYALFMALFVLFRREHRVALFENRTVAGFFVLLIGQSVVWTVLSVPSNTFDYAMEYTRMYLPYLASMWFSVVYFARRKMMDRYANSTFWCISICLLALFALHFQPGAFLQNLTRLFDRYGRYREAYGFDSPDIPACMALCVLACSLFLWEKSRRLKKVWILVVDLVMAVLILSTGSRAQIVALGMGAALMAFYQTRRLRFRTRRQKQFFECSKWAVILGAVILAGANYFQHTSLEEALLNSNRMGLFSINLPLLLRENKLWMGLVYASAGRFGAGQIGLYQVYYVDNYYIYLLMSSGVMGCAIQLAAIFLVIQGIRTTVSRHNLQTAERLTVMVAVNLFMGLFFCAVIYPNYIHCTLFWALPMMYIYAYNKEEKDVSCET